MRFTFQTLEFLGFQSFFNFLCWAIQSFILRGLPRKTLKFVQTIVSQANSPALWVSTFYVEQLKSFNLGRLPLPWRTPKFGSSNCLTNIFLHCEFQLSMLSRSKFFFEGSSWKTPKFVQTIVSQTTSSYSSTLWVSFLYVKQFKKVLFLGRSPPPL